MTQTVEFTVSGEQRIHCASCEHHSEQVLRQVKGVLDVRASVGNQHVVATIDIGQVGPERLRDKVCELGYEVASQGGVG